MTSDWPSKVTVRDRRRRRTALLLSNTEDVDEIEMDTWPDNEYAELKIGTVSNWRQMALRLGAYDVSGSPYMSTESEKGTISRETDISRIREGNKRIDTGCLHIRWPLYTWLRANHAWRSLDSLRFHLVT